MADVPSQHLTTKCLVHYTVNFARQKFDNLLHLCIVHSWHIRVCLRFPTCFLWAATTRTLVACFQPNQVLWLTTFSLAQHGKLCVLNKKNNFSCRLCLEYQGSSIEQLMDKLRILVLCLHL